MKSHQNKSHNLPHNTPFLPHTGLLIFCGKKSKISRDFQGQIRGKIGRFRGILAEKSHIAKDFWGKF